MDPVETFLTTLNENNSLKYKEISENALKFYLGSGRLTERQHAWAVRTAGFQKVPVPTEFNDVTTFTAKHEVQNAAQVVQLPARKNEAHEIMASGLLEAAAALISAAERLKAL